MNRTIILLILSHIIANVQSQNLVVNPGFEDYDKGFLEIGLSFSAFLPCKEWWVAGLGTPDYYNRHYKPEGRTIPNTHLGYNESHSGDAMVGLIVTGFCNVSNGAGACVEHVQGTLVSPLIKDSLYRVGFYIRPTITHSGYFTDNVGVHFSSDKYYGDDINLFFYGDRLFGEITADASNPDGHYLTDSAWVLVEGIYKAKGGEKYLTIGMCFDENEEVVEAWEKYVKNDSDYRDKKLAKKIKKYILIKNKQCIDTLHPSSDPYHMSYYFVDDVHVIPIRSE